MKTINKNSTLKLLTPHQLTSKHHPRRLNSLLTLSLTLPLKQLELPFGADGVDLVNENDGGRVFLCHPEELPHQLGPVSQVLLDQL